MNAFFCSGFVGYTVSGALGQAIGWDWTMSVFGFTFLAFVLPLMMVYFKGRSSRAVSSTGYSSLNTADYGTIA